MHRRPVSPYCLSSRSPRRLTGGPWSRALRALVALAGLLPGAWGCGGGTSAPADASADLADDVAKDAGPSAPAVRINEVAPAGVPADWIELWNAGDIPVELGGWTLRDSDPTNAPYAFSAGTTLEPHATLLVSRDDTGATGFSFGLGPDDALTLADAAGDQVDRVSWSGASKIDALGRLPDGAGALRPLYVPTPGRPNQAPDAGTVRVNEVSSAGDDPIELYNPGDEPVELGGWHLTDARGDDSQERYTFPVGTTLAPGAFLVLRKDQDHAFGLGADDAVVLYDDAGIVDLVDWAAGDAGVSFCRVPDGEGAPKPCAAATLGAANAP